MEQRITIKVDADFEDIIPKFMQNRRSDIRRMLEALEQADYETIRVLGHGMKGFGKSYGFAFISEVGSRLEQAAQQRSAEEIKAGVNGLADYLDRVHVVYE